MIATSENSLLESLNWRYATKEFDPSRKIEAATLSTIEESLVLTPSSYGLQPWKFIIISDQDLKAKMPEISWNQQQLKDCSQVVVFTAKTGYSREDLKAFIDRMAEVRDVSPESLSGYEQVVANSLDKATEEGWLDAWARNQVYIALGQLLLVAASLGVDACPMEGIEAEKYDQLLDLEGSGYETVVVCPLGYRSEKDKYAAMPKVRYANEVVVEHR